MSADQIVPTAAAFDQLHIGKSKGYDLIREGELDQVHIGSKSYVTQESIDRFVSKLLTQVASK